METEKCLDQPKNIREDRRVAKLLAEGWVFHSNYDPQRPGDLEEKLRISEFAYQRPSNARELLIIDAAYNICGKPVPRLNAIYMRNFVPVEEVLRKLSA